MGAPPIPPDTPPKFIPRARIVLRPVAQGLEDDAEVGGLPEKTISITFRTGKAPIASVTGVFAATWERRQISWTNRENLEALLEPPYSSPLPTYHYGDLFAEAMTGLAERHGLEIEIREFGDWLSDNDNILA